MAIDEAHLQSQYHLVKLPVKSSTKISDRTASIVSHLRETEQRDAGKPVLLSLTAHAKASNKLISIVEIAKRELVSNGVKCYQYNVLTSELVDVPREKKTRKANHSGGKAGATEDDDDDKEEAFEEMGASLGETKKRNVPVLTILLSRMSVKELRVEYGYVGR